MKNYTVTPKVASELSFMLDRPVTGFLFSTTSRNVVICSCGCHRVIQGTNNNHCPDCGGELIVRHNAPSYLDYSSCKRVMEFDGDIRRAFRLELRAAYDSPSDSVKTKISKIEELSIDCKTFKLTVPRNVRDIDSAVVALTDDPDLHEHLTIASMTTAGYFSEDTLHLCLKFISSCGWSKAAMTEKPFFYALMTKLYLMGKVKPKATDELMLNSLGITKPSIQNLIIKSPETFGSWEIRSPGGRRIRYLSVTDESVEQQLQALKTLNDDEFPNSELYIELMSRGVLKLSSFHIVVENYKSIKEHGVVIIPPDVWWQSSTKMEISPALADVFADFVRKYCNMSFDLSKEFAERTSKLMAAGVPRIIENYLDKEYYRIVNADSYMYPGTSFQEDFQKDPLQCLKTMK